MMKIETNKKRIGRVFISDLFCKTEPKLLKKILNKLDIDHVWHNQFEGLYEYTAISNYFRDVVQGEKIPEYMAKISYNGDDAVIDFVEVGKK